MIPGIVAGLTSDTIRWAGRTARSVDLSGNIGGGAPMGNLYGKGDRGAATRLHAELVRGRGRCEAAGWDGLDCSDRLECAHIMSRSFARTRTDLSNALCLCWAHHKRFTNDPPGFYLFCASYIGEDTVLELRAKALDADGQRVNWKAEKERLQRIKQRRLSRSPVR